MSIENNSFRLIHYIIIYAKIIHLYLYRDRFQIYIYINTRTKIEQFLQFRQIKISSKRFQSLVFKNYNVFIKN